jgi:3-oxoacyl-[acyl-carrier-protein] synthase-3
MDSGASFLRSATAPAPVTSRFASLPASLCSILGLGHYLPSRVLTNDELALTVDTSDQWIVERTGIRGRHCAAPNEATSDMARLAALRALEDAQLAPSDLDLILFATSTPDTPVPSTACHLQAALGCSGVPAMDINAGCAGFGYAMQLAASSIRGGLHQRVLVIGADTLTRITNYADRQSCILFGDGAGAAVVGARGRYDVIYSEIGADGTGADLIRVPAGGSRTPASLESVTTAGHTLELHGREVFKAAVLRMAECLRRAAKGVGVQPSDFDVVIPHQANARIIEAVGRQLDIGPERLVVDIGETGNTASASIPIALERARGGLRPGQLVAVVGFGAGLAWACQVLLVREM